MHCKKLFCINSLQNILYMEIHFETWFSIWKFIAEHGFAHINSLYNIVLQVKFY